MMGETKHTYLPTLVVVEGGQFQLLCEVDNWYNYCTFKHNGKICDFEWNGNGIGNFTVAECKNYENRMDFSGTYPVWIGPWICAVNITDVRFEDAGAWSCEVESDGLFRGIFFISRNFIIL